MWSFSYKGAFPATSFPATQGIWTKNLRQKRISWNIARFEAATQVLIPFFLRRDKHHPDVQIESSGLSFIHAGKILR